MGERKGSSRVIVKPKDMKSFSKGADPVRESLMYPIPFLNYEFSIRYVPIYNTQVLPVSYT